MEELFDHPVLGPITIRKSLKAKRITLAVRPSGEVRLTLPPRLMRRALAFLDKRLEWVAAARERMAARVEAAETLSPLTEEQLKSLREQARADLPERVRRLSTAVYLPYRSLRVSAARTRWGSCSGRNALSISLFVMILPEHLRDYIILHELCHTVHHDHSTLFHELVDRHTRTLLGRSEKEFGSELRRYHIPR